MPSAYKITRSADKAPAKPKFRHCGLVFRCFLCHVDVRREFEPFSFGFAGIRYFNAFHHGSGIITTFGGYGRISDIKRAIQGNYRRLPIQNASTKARYYIEPCSADEGYGVLCNKVEANHEEFMYMTHQCCWNLATAQVGEDEAEHTAREAELVGLAHRTRVIPARTEGSASKRHIPFRLLLDKMEPDTTTPLGGILKKISQLPQELVDMVMVHLDGTVVGALFKTRQTLLEMLSESSTASSTASEYFCSDLGPIALLGSDTYLSARMSNMLGDIYVTDLSRRRHWEPKTDGALSIPVSNNKVIMGIGIAVSAFGLRALRILYSDASTSSWLGNPADCWLGTVHGTWSTIWEVRSDDFRVLRIQQNTWLLSSPLYKYLKQSDRVKTFCLGLWDTDMRSQLHGQLASILPRSIYRPRVFFYPSSRLLNYLPIVRDSAYASAITVYCSKAGLHGMRVHFCKDSVTFGEQKGYRLHFALAEGEYLSSAWANIPSRTFITAYVSASHADTLCNVVRPISDFLFAVTTSRGRTYHFGAAYTRCDSIEPSFWSCISYGSPTKITGFIFDAVAYRQNHSFHDIGVTEEKDFVDNALPHGTHIPEFEYPQEPEDQEDADDDNEEDDDDEIDDLGKFRYHTCGSLDNVARLRSQRFKIPDEDHNRILGLQIIHHDGSIDTLGQWDPDKIDSTTEFYNFEHHGPLRCLDITACEVGPYITGITTNIGPSDGEPRVTRAYSWNNIGYGEKSWKILPGWRLGWVFGPEETEDEDVPGEASDWDDVWYYELDLDTDQPVMGGRELEAII